MGPAISFFCDGMLGHVTRWLRLMGYDAEYAGSALTDDEIVARLEGADRVLATRDVHLSQRAARRGIRVVRLSGGALEDELVELLAALHERPDEANRFRRCTACNGNLERVSEDTVRERVPGNLPGNLREFQKCAQCGHVYWPGSHVGEIAPRLDRVLRRLPSDV